jgi:formimidoylglutamate deiminase
MVQRKALHFARALLPEGWQNEVSVRITDGLITSVESDCLATEGVEQYAIAVPGMPNLHSHAFQRAMAGLAEHGGGNSDNFWSWRKLMYRLAARIGPDELRIIAAMAQIEMLESGFTRVAEFHYLHHTANGARFGDIAEMSKAIFAAVGETGIGITHLPVFYAHSGFGGLPPADGQRRFTCDIDLFTRLLESCRTAAKALPDATVGVAPHSLRAVTPAEICMLQELAGEAPIHIHIAEQVREVEDCQAALGSTPVRWLLDNANVSGQWCLVHATHVTEAEVTGVAQSEAVVGLCPITEANLGDGIFPAKDFVDAGGRFGIGSDSNVRIDMTEELRLLEYGQRLTHQARNVLLSQEFTSNGRFLYQTAVAGGAQAMGVDGGLRPGASADFVTLDAKALQPGQNVADSSLDQLIFAAGTRAIDRVWRRGRCVVIGGQHVQRERIEGEYRKMLLGLIA